jgi:hypothetical protein
MIYCFVFLKNEDISGTCIASKYYVVIFCSYVLKLYSVVIFRSCILLLYVDIFCSYIVCSYVLLLHIV